MYTISMSQLKNSLNPKDYGLFDYKETPEGLIINQQLEIQNKNLTQIPFPIKSLNGYLNISSNRISSWKNFPQNINGNTTYAHNNQLTSLNDIKNHIFSALNVNNNSIKSLEGCPNVSNLNIDYNELSSFRGLNSNVMSLSVQHNYKITSLDGLNSKMKSLNISYTGITELSYPLHIIERIVLYGLKITKIENLTFDKTAQVYAEYQDIIGSNALMDFYSKNSSLFTISLSNEQKENIHNKLKLNVVMDNL